MSPENTLLGSGIPPVPFVDVHPTGIHLRSPAWRYHQNCPDGMILKTDEEVDQADADGWLDHPGKVRLLEGHEKIWEDYQKSLHPSQDDEPKVKMWPMSEEVGSVQVTIRPEVKTEDQIAADALKAESDRIETKRLEAEQKEKEKKQKADKKEEEKRLEDERKAKEYEDAKTPVGQSLCTVCGKVFDTERALNMHGIAAHRERKKE